MIKKEDAISFLSATGQPVTTERFAKTFLEMKKISGQKDDKKVWDDYIHDIIKACVSLEEVQNFIQANSLM